jgi:uncharacterized coiled-coil protein SlyX
MSEEHTGEERTSEEAWSEVGRQFEALGESLAKAFRAAWEREETRRQVQSVQDGLEKMVNKVNRAVEDAGQSPQGQKLRTEAAKTAESLRAAGEQTWQEAQPHLLAALAKINAELKRVVDRMEGRETASQEPPVEAASSKAEEQASGDA